MANEQPYLEVEGNLYWTSSESDPITGKVIYTYLMDHVPGKIVITSNIELDVANKKRIVKLDELHINRPILTKEVLGTRYEEGSLKAKGVIVETIPENGVDVRQYITDSMKPGTVDRTFGKGTIWEQLSSEEDNQ